jgi:hypothetical protein
MTRAVAHILRTESPVGEIARFALATGFPLALIFAGRALPF